MAVAVLTDAEYKQVYDDLRVIGQHINWESSEAVNALTRVKNIVDTGYSDQERQKIVRDTRLAQKLKRAPI